MRFLLIVVVTISIINLNAHYIFNLIVRRYCQSFSVLLNFASCKMFGDRMIIDEYRISSVIRRKKYLKYRLKKENLKNGNSVEKQSWSSLFLSWNDFSLWNIFLPNHSDQVPSFLLFVIVLLLCFILVILFFVLLLLLPEDFRTGIQRNRGWQYSLSFLYALWTYYVNLIIIF